MKQIVVVGAGGHARVVADIIRLTGEYEVRGFLDGVDPARQDEIFEGSRILGGHDVLATLIADGVDYATIAIGDNGARADLAEMARQLGFQLPILMHRNAVLAAGVRCEAGGVICAGAIVNPGVRLGANVIINTGATVDHDCVIEDNVHVGPGAHLAGHVRVGAGALIGVGASVVSRIAIGGGAVVGAGAAVVSDVEAGQTVAGVPARPIA